MSSIMLSEFEDEYDSEDVVREMLPEIYTYLVQHIESNFKNKQMMSTRLCAVWLDDSGNIVDSGMSSPLFLARPGITSRLDDLLLNGIPNQPSPPITIAAASMFVLDENNEDGLLLLLKSKNYEAEQLTKVNRDKLLMDVSPLLEKNIRAINRHEVLH